MITLTANVVKKLINAQERDRVFLISTQFSTTAITKIAYTPDDLASDSGGFFISTITEVRVLVPAGKELFIVSDGVGPTGLAEVVGPYTNAIRLY
jgi:hypothetical protein